MLGVGASIAIYTQATPNWTILGLALFLLTLFISILVGVFVNSQIILPILYNLPRSIYHCIKGEVRFIAIPAQFVAPVIWCVGLIILGFLLEGFAPSVMRFLSTNLAVNLGQIIALIVVLLSVVTPSGLRDLRADYEEKTYATYRKQPSSQERLSLDDVVRLLIVAILHQDIDLGGFPTQGLSETDLDIVHVCIGEYLLSMGFNQLMERTGLSEEELERHFESAGPLAYKDLGEPAPETSVSVLLSMKDYYLHDLPSKCEQYLATMQERYSKYGSDEVNLEEARKEVEELGPSFLYHQAFAHRCVADFNPEDRQQQKKFDLSVRIARQGEKHMDEMLNLMFKKAHIIV